MKIRIHLCILAVSLSPMYSLALEVISFLCLPNRFSVCTTLIISSVILEHLWRVLLALESNSLCHTGNTLKKQHQNISCLSYIGIDTWHCKNLLMVEVTHENMRILMEPRSFPSLS